MGSPFASVSVFPSQTAAFNHADDRSHKQSCMVTREFKLSTIITLLSFHRQFIASCAQLSLLLISRDCLLESKPSHKVLEHQKRQRELNSRTHSKTCQYNGIKISFLLKFDMQWHLTRQNLFLQTFYY